MANVLIDLSNDLAGIVGTTGLAVVRVEARPRISASGIMWSSDGLIVTTHHVIEQEEEIKIIRPRGLSTRMKRSIPLVGFQSKSSTR